MPTELSSSRIIKPVIIKDNSQVFLFRFNKQGRKEKGIGLAITWESQAQEHFEKEKKHKFEVLHWETEGDSFVLVPASWSEHVLDQATCQMLAL